MGWKDIPDILLSDKEGKLQIGMCLKRGMWTWIWERPGWVGVRRRVEAKQMAARVRGKDGITRRLLGLRTTDLLGDRYKRSLEGGLAPRAPQPESAEPPGPWGHLLSTTPAEVL